MSDIYLRLITSLVAGQIILRETSATGLYMGPYFPTPQTRNITVHQNAAAYLPCAVKQLGDKSVSWVRQRDADILTVDRYTFVRDERLTVHYTPSTETWTLVIKYAQERDAGTYECQISTEPKMSMWLHLNVIVPRVEIVGEVDKYIRKGSTTRLECTVSSTVQLPDYIFWYHSGERLLEYDNPRVKFSVSRRGGQGSEMSITSLLIISNTQPDDEGNYTCLPSNLHSATTNLHVLNDEHPAAMQTGAAMLTDPPSPWGMMMVVLIAFIFVQTHHNFNLSNGAPGQRLLLHRKDSVRHHTEISSSKTKHVLKLKTGIKGIILRSHTEHLSKLHSEITSIPFTKKLWRPLWPMIYREGNENKKKVDKMEINSLLHLPSGDRLSSLSLHNTHASCIPELQDRSSNHRSKIPSFKREMDCYADSENNNIFPYGHLCSGGHSPNFSLPTKIADNNSY